MKITVLQDAVIGEKSDLLLGQFLEHFHRQVYGGVFDPSSPFADEEGLRQDVLDALRELRVPIIRWPGGCFVSAYHWKNGVGQTRIPVYDKAWRVEDPNTFGTDEFVSLCRKIGCEPYICTNAGTGTPEEMSDWVEYCNLPTEGQFAKARIAAGHTAPHDVRFWSIGNENYFSSELGAKESGEWGRFVAESAKLMLHVDPTLELTAAAITEIPWCVELLQQAGRYLKWISIHEYWDGLWEVEDPADYEQSMAYTATLGNSIAKIRGLLTAFGLEKQIKIAYDEWNLRGWHHPKNQGFPYAPEKEEYLLPRDKNDINSTYTMADAVFSACFLNSCIRNCDIVGMANFAPVVNTRGCIFTHKDGIVKRSTFYVFKLYAELLGRTVLQSFAAPQADYRVTSKRGEEIAIDSIDAVCTRREDGTIVIAAANKHARETKTLSLALEFLSACRCLKHTVNGPSPDAYNDIGRSEVGITCSEENLAAEDGLLHITLEPHSVNVIELLK